MISNDISQRREVQSPEPRDSEKGPKIEASIYRFCSTADLGRRTGSVSREMGAFEQAGTKPDPSADQAVPNRNRHRDQAAYSREITRCGNLSVWDQVRTFRRFARRALALAGRDPWLAFFNWRCGLAIWSSRAIHVV